eukprot:6685179-Pyramimonas_sp.AAC.1
MPASAVTTRVALALAPGAPACTPSRRGSVRARSSTLVESHSVRFGSNVAPNCAFVLRRCARRTGSTSRAVRPVMMSAASPAVGREVMRVVETEAVTVKVQLGLDGVGTVHR